ncbi:cryptochrome/photolyase family protein [Algoriphagus aestuariicola]|uniref:Cryptochrome/photolyase family protein n=1 Tax=Algoriphagus aestuariicola TaxID=1852016 RepID=A0ABS3BPH0_9BACT|nr:cryptochrome/photolyase family protein [Algoriphagus aestuariicola]MBN7801189.1 cryptochrome/photolyase family protein [Algoriphagus aestuariicola]
MTKAVNLIFPHQLFSVSPLLDNGHEIYLVEEHLFFRQYRFHKQKLAFHRASMKAYQGFLEEKGRTVRYIESMSGLSDIRKFRQVIDQEGITEIHCVDPVDDWLEKRLREMAVSLELKFYDSPAFLNSRAELSDFFKPDRKSFFQTTFYKQERIKRKILLTRQGEPEGGNWTFDSENRKKYPKGKTPPSIRFPDSTPYWEEALAYTKKHFGVNPGELTKGPIYPIDQLQAKAWLDQFFEHRFHQFGDYEDAIVKNASFLHHSLLSPLLNVGLLVPEYVLKECLDFARREKVPINSTEGFVRQITGWREFIRGVYVYRGSYSRTKNFWGFKRRIPACFYDGTTGIPPVDQTIKKVLNTGYCHHIERLMILGNFMLLCEFDPDEVYRWFMELFIDAYDWVMVPNVYGMSQFADGGLFATKPYIGGSNYLRKMSDYPKGEWEDVWDGLFWRFVDKHSDFFKSNPRLSMMHHTWNRMEKGKKHAHLSNANKFLEKCI